MTWPPDPTIGQLLRACRMPQSVVGGSDMYEERVTHGRCWCGWRGCCVRPRALCCLYLLKTLTARDTATWETLAKINEQGLAVYGYQGLPRSLDYFTVAMAIAKPTAGRAYCLGGLCIIICIISRQLRYPITKIVYLFCNTDDLRTPILLGRESQYTVHS